MGLSPFVPSMDFFQILREIRRIKRVNTFSHLLFLLSVRSSVLSSVCSSGLAELSILGGMVKS